MNPDSIEAQLLSLNISPPVAQFFAYAGCIVGLLLLALLASLAGKALIRSVIHPLVRRTRIEWDDLLIASGTFTRLSHIVPAMVISILAPLLFRGHPDAMRVLQSLLNAYIIVIVLLVIDAFLSFFREVWSRGTLGNRYPAKSFTQAAKLVINIIGCVFILSVVLGKSPLVFFSGLGAMTAVLLLIFRDAILGLVAGFQIAANNMVMVGDWIEMPARDADGDVIDVSLTTVKVQNWDKTITTIPTYALISDSFRNWRGMSESGGRRVKRALHIDLRTIQFADQAMLDRFNGMRLLRPYLEHKLEEIAAHNETVKDDLNELINGRRLTNIGTFRAYCVAYLRAHPKVHQNLTLLVRQLAPGPKGLPIEIYFFANDTVWARYEDIQSDVFDHLLSVLPEFGLSAFQAPSGADIEQCGQSIAALNPAR